MKNRTVKGLNQYKKLILISCPIEEQLIKIKLIKCQ